MGGKWFNQRSNWLFTGLPREFQAARLRPPGRSACPKRRLAKPVLDKSEFFSFLAFYPEPVAPAAKKAAAEKAPVRRDG